MLTFVMPEINFYRSENNSCPVLDFLNSLSGKQAQKVAWILEFFEDTDIVPSQYFKKLKGSDDIWEIRIIYAGDIFRLLGFFDNKNIFVLTNGFVKKTQKTPPNEIALSEKRKKQYFEREKNE